MKRGHTERLYAFSVSGEIMERKRIKMSTPQEVRRTLSRVANMVLNGELEAKEANAIMYACNSVLNAIRTDDQQAKLDELERLINQRGRK